jgi:hypothetical protein
MNKTKKILLRFVLPVLLGMILLSLILLPYGLKKYINEHGNEYTGRKIAVRDIQFNYFTTTFRILDFRMFEADGKATFVSFDSLTVDISPFPLLASKLVINKIRLVKPLVNISRKDSVYNFDDIITFLNKKPKADTTKKGAPFRYLLNNIAMEQGKLVFNDKTVDYVTNLDDLRFFIPSIHFDQSEIKDTGIKFHFMNGGFFQAKASYNEFNGAFTADFSLDKLDISPFLPYVKGYFKVNGINGLVGGDFHLSGNINKPDSVMLRGDANAENFAAKDLTNQKVLGARTIHVTLRDTWPMKFNFNFGKIKLSEPYVYVELKDSTINLLHLMVETPADTVPFTYSYRIGEFKIEDGQMEIRDNSFEEPFDYHLSEIAMKTDSISSESKWLNTFASMKLNKRGKLQGELGFNPSDPYELKVNYVITNFQLSDLNIFSTHYVGYPFLLGNMYYKGKTVIANKQLNSENKLIIRNVQLGKKSGGLMDLPLKLALYLLKDIHGDITLDLPVTGDLNDPKTKIGRLVWQVVKNVIVKVVASPFLAMGKLLGVEPAEVKGIEFNYADTTLTATHLRRIKLFTELEQKKPDMKMELTFFNDAELEKKDIALQEAGKQFLTATGFDSKKDNPGFVAFLSEKVHRDSLSAVAGSLLLIGEHKLDSIQQSITKYRIVRIEKALRSFSDSSKIKVVIANKEVPENVGSRPVFELKYTVED